MDSPIVRPLTAPLMAALIATGCGAASPCMPSTAAGEPYCAILCAPNPERASHACPNELANRTDTDGAAICRAEEGPLPQAICDQIRGACPSDGPRRLTGPRCTPDNPLCLPDAYEGCHAFDVDGPRVPSELGHSEGACTHDGECVVAGCGNDCVLWSLAGAGDCLGYTPGAPTFCGCVREAGDGTGQCEWFTQ